MLLSTDDLAHINGVVACIKKVFEDKAVPTEAIKQFNHSGYRIRFSVWAENGRRVLKITHRSFPQSSLTIDIGVIPPEPNPTTTPSGDADGFLQERKVA